MLVKNPGMLKLMNGLGFAANPFAEDPDFMLATRTM